MIRVACCEVVWLIVVVDETQNRMIVNDTDFDIIDDIDTDDVSEPTWRMKMTVFFKILSVLYLLHVDGC